MVELKVWLDGMQRVVCGVTEATTCQEVVVALAQATGRTGRFTLVERWRDTEHPLSPVDRPLLTLQKWGEFAGNVRFVLRYSDRDSNTSSPMEAITARKGCRVMNVSSAESAGQDNNTIGDIRASLRKSLTFSGGGGRSRSVGGVNSRRNLPNSLHHRFDEAKNSSLESLEDKKSETSSTASPSASFDGSEPRRNGHATTTATSAATGRWGGSLDRHTGNVQPQNGHVKVSPQSPRQRLRHEQSSSPARALQNGVIGHQHNHHQQQRQHQQQQLQEQRHQQQQQHEDLERKIRLQKQQLEEQDRRMAQLDKEVVIPAPLLLPADALKLP